MSYVITKSQLESLRVGSRFGTQTFTYHCRNSAASVLFKTQNNKEITPTGVLYDGCQVRPISLFILCDWNPLIFCTLFLSVNFYCLLRFFLLFSECQLTLATNFWCRMLIAYRHNEQLHLVAVHRYMPLELLCCYTFWMFLPPPPSRVDPLCQLPLSLKSRPREWSNCHWETLQPPIHPLPAKSLALRWDLPVSTSLAPASFYLLRQKY